MKLALIPPFCHLEDTAKTDYQLMLPHLITHPAYEKTYLDLCADKDQFVILDNGVAEGKQVEFKEILDIADHFGVDEVVLPDVMGDCVATMNAASRAIYVHGMHYPVHYMYVLQGQTMEEVLMSARFALSFGSVRTLGIPRHLVTTIGEPTVRWRIAVRIMREMSKQMATRSIHFLGMNATTPREMEYGPRWLKHMIRGFDTSAPYNFAFHGLSMNGLAVANRPSDYFARPEVDFSPLLVQDNIAYLEGCL